MNAALHQMVYRERLVAEHIPFVAQVTEAVVRTRGGDFLQTFGSAVRPLSPPMIAKSMIGTSDSMSCGETSQSAGRAVDASGAATRKRLSATGSLRPEFARELNHKYRQRLQHETLMVNDMYLTVVFRPLRNSAQRPGPSRLAPCRSGYRSGCAHRRGRIHRPNSPRS